MIPHSDIKRQCLSQKADFVALIAITFNKWLFALMFDINIYVKREAKKLFLNVIAVSATKFAHGRQTANLLEGRVLRGRGVLISAFGNPLKKLWLVLEATLKPVCKFQSALPEPTEKISVYTLANIMKRESGPYQGLGYNFLCLVRLYESKLSTVVTNV